MSPSVSKPSPSKVRILVLAKRVLLLAAVGLIAPCVWAAGAAGAEPGFGIERFENAAVTQEGIAATQAGSHPYEMTTTIFFNHHEVEEEGAKLIFPNGEPKDLEVGLPAGLVVNSTATETRCTEAQLEATNGCPDSAAVGVVDIDVDLLHPTEGAGPVYNMVPPPGVPAELGFNVAGLGVVVHIGGKVRTGGDYGISAEVLNISQKLPLYGTRLTLWGRPSDPSHDKERGFCGTEGAKAFVEAGGTCPVERIDKALLTLPSSCPDEGLSDTARADSWQEVGMWTEPLRSSPAMPAITGCQDLDFSPRLDVEPAPSAVSAASPSGLNVYLQIPQDESATALAEADLESAVVTLPAGMSLSPSAAAGLEACTPEEIGLNNAEPIRCPPASKVGSVEIVTPLLSQPLGGSVYLAQQGDAGSAQGSNPFGSLVALYLVAEGSGVLVKLPGHVELGGERSGGEGLQPGQVRATFGMDPVTKQFLPQLPFSELKMSFFGGPRAALASPPQCGAYITTSALTPYSVATAAHPASNFTIASGCSGGFSPTFTAGTSVNQAGGFSPFSVAFARNDDEQDLAGITVHMPPGLLGKIADVPECSEAEAQAINCPASSQIGEVAVAAGAGPEPYWIKGGRAYLTGPYGGAPYGLAIVVPTEAGPFNLGPEVVRAAIFVDPHTAALTIVSTPLPTSKDGVPFQIKEVVVNANRENFVFNPTTCEPETVQATIAGEPLGGSAEAPRSAQVSSPFAVAGCRNLPFKPVFSAVTQAHAHRLTGASLRVKVAQKPGEADIRKVDLQLPVALPARLPTLRQACTEAQFAANPAGCPPGSIIGEGTATTPVLSVPLTGPAYIVSHGGVAYPDVVFVLQGAGVTIELTGGTQIKKNLTYSQFETVPDAPVSSFEAILPEGQHSVLTSNLPAKAHEDFCGRSLTMPTTIVAQNGAVVNQPTKVAVTGCPKHRVEHRHAGHHSSKHKHKAKTIKRR